MAPLVRFTLAIPAELHEKLKAAATRDRRSVTAQINHIVENYLAAHTPLGEREAVDAARRAGLI